MYLQMHPDEAALVERVRDFVEREVLPKTRQWEADKQFPDSIWPRLGELGLLGLALPREKGGTGASCRAYTEICREIAKGDPALSMNLAAINALCVAHFDRFA